MSKTIRKHFTFRIDNKVVSIEAGSGYVANSSSPMFDHVDLVIRGLSEDGRRPGKIEQRAYGVRRSQIALIALNFLAIAEQMTPKTLYARSDSVHCSTKEPKVVNLVKSDRDTVEHLSTEDVRVIKKNVMCAFDNLRSRMHIVQRCLKLVEKCSDGDANKLDMFLTMIETQGMASVIGDADASSAHVDPSQAIN